MQNARSNYRKSYIQKEERNMDKQSFFLKLFIDRFIENTKPNLRRDEMKLTNTTIDINNLIQNEVERISTKYGKDFLDCEDLRKITGLGRDNIRNLFKSKNFPTTKIGKRQVVSVLNFVTWQMITNKVGEIY